MEVEHGTIQWPGNHQVSGRAASVSERESSVRSPLKIESLFPSSLGHLQCDHRRVGGTLKQSKREQYQHSFITTYIVSTYVYMYTA